MIYHHTAVHTNDVASSVSWYIENLAMLLVGGMTLALTLPDKHPPHIAFEVDSLDKFPCYPNEIKMHRDGSHYYYQEAPDGTVIEWLYWEPALRKW